MKIKENEKLKFLSGDWLSLISVCLSFCMGTGTSLRSLVMSWCLQKEELQRHSRKPFSRRVHGRVMEHHRGLPVAPTVAMPAELGTGQGWHSDRACWGTVGNVHTCCFFLPVCFSKCLPKEGLFPRWRWSTWWKDCGDESAAKVHPATGSKKRVRRFGRKRMETENPSKDRLKSSRDKVVWPHLLP